MEPKTTVLVDKLYFPEGPRWHEGKLWFCDYYTRQVMNVDLQGAVQTVAELSDMPTALCWTPDGRLLIVSAAARRLLTLEDHALVEVADLSALVAYPCGELTIDSLGRAYNGNIGYDLLSSGTNVQAAAPGSILLIEPFGSARVVADGLAFPNGMVITPDGQTLIVAESHAARLTAFAIESDGSLSHRRVWAQFEKQPGEPLKNPDGLSLDAEGAVWVASPVTHEILRVHEGTEIVDRVLVDGYPLACMLGGPERRTLFITITTSLNPYDNNGRGRIETIQVDVPGAGLP